VKNIEKCSEITVCYTEKRANGEEDSRKIDTKFGVEKSKIPTFDGG
jgi:hypothetical protein